jgi:hypothetical protein
MLATSFILGIIVKLLIDIGIIFLCKKMIISKIIFIGKGYPEKGSHELARR